MNFVLGMLTGAVMALAGVWYVRHPDERSAEEPTDKGRSNTPEKEEHDRFMKEQQRQFDKLLSYTGERQK